MKTIPLSDPVPIQNLKRKHNISKYTLVRTRIGYNDEVYFLFSGSDTGQVDEQENLWFYYYDDFHLVRTDFKKDLVYHPGICNIMNKYYS